MSKENELMVLKAKKEAYEESIFEMQLELSSVEGKIKLLEDA